MVLTCFFFLGSSSFSDFTAGCDTNLLFQGVNKQCHNITIHDDDICEWKNGTNEYFTSYLAVTSGSDINVIQEQIRTYIDDSNEIECSTLSLALTTKLYLVFTDLNLTHIQAFMLDTADQCTPSLKVRGTLSSVYKLSTHREEQQDPSASQYPLQMAQQVKNCVLTSYS